MSRECKIKCTCTGIRNCLFLTWWTREPCPGRTASWRQQHSQQSVSGSFYPPTQRSSTTGKHQLFIQVIQNVHLRIKTPWRTLCLPVGGSSTLHKPLSACAASPRRCQSEPSGSHETWRKKDAAEDNGSGFTHSTHTQKHPGFNKITWQMKIKVSVAGELTWRGRWRSGWRIWPPGGEESAGTRQSSEGWRSRLHLRGEETKRTKSETIDKL